MSKFKIWMAQIRADFLVLAVFLVAIGLAYAALYQPESFNWLHAILIAVGTISAHISVNLFNELSDYYTKIDFRTSRTPFSGGSGMLSGGKTKPGQVKAGAIASLSLSAVIGIYFTFTAHWSILIFAIIGATAIVFYTNFLARYLLGEFFAGLALGSLVVIGAYIAMAATPGQALSDIVPLEVWLISIPPGILTFLLLLLNEFPDVEADKTGGRRHLVITFGKKIAAGIYTAGILATYAVIIILPIAGISSYWLYLALLPLPVGLKASQIALSHGHDNVRLLPAQGMNVVTVLATDLLIAVSVIIQLW